MQLGVDGMRAVKLLKNMFTSDPAFRPTWIHMILCPREDSKSKPLQQQDMLWEMMMCAIHSVPYKTMFGSFFMLTSHG